MELKKEAHRRIGIPHLIRFTTPMPIPGLTAATVRAHASSDSYERGKDYYERDAVLSVERRDGHLVVAFVQGSHHLPYSVRLRHDEAGLTDVSCTCPYYSGSWCKHIVAVLLFCLGDAEAVSTSVSVLLDGMDREALVDLIERLATRHPDLEGWLEEERARFR